MMMRLIQFLMMTAVAGLLSSCADFGVAKAIPVAPNSQHLYAEGDGAQIMPVLLPDKGL